MFLVLDIIAFLFAILLFIAAVMLCKERIENKEPLGVFEIIMVTLFRINLEACRRHLIC